MNYTTFEQTDYGFVLLDINKKQSDKNRIRNNKIERFGPNRPLQWNEYTVDPHFMISANKAEQIFIFIFLNCLDIN